MDLNDRDKEIHEAIKLTQIEYDTLKEAHNQEKLLTHEL